MDKRTLPQYLWHCTRVFLNNASVFTRPPLVPKDKGEKIYSPMIRKGITRGKNSISSQLEKIPQLCKKTRKAEQGRYLCKKKWFACVCTKRNDRLPEKLGQFLKSFTQSLKVHFTAQCSHTCTPKIPVIYSFVSRGR